MIPKSGDRFSDKIMRRQKARFYGPDIRLPPGSGTAGDQTFDLFDADLRHIEPRRFRRFLVGQQSDLKSPFLWAGYTPPARLGNRRRSNIRLIRRRLKTHRTPAVSTLSCRATVRSKKPVFMGRIYASRQAREPPAIKHSTYSTPT